jgi:hypothetical protein
MPPGRALPFGVVAGLVSALFFVLIGTGNPGSIILFGMSLLPVMIAGLGAGTGAMAAAVTVGIGMSAWIGGIGYGILFLGLVAIPNMLLVPLALIEPKPPSAQRLVWGITGYGCALFALIYAVARARNFELAQGLEASALRFLTQLQKDTDVQLPEPAEKLAATLSFWAVGGFVANWMLNVVGNGLLAQGALARFDKTLRPTPSMSSLELPYPLGLSFALLVALWWFGTGELAYIGGNLAEILAVPLLLGGFAVVHAVLHATVRRPMARLAMLVAIYIVALLTVWPLALVVALGIADQWIGLRRRLLGETH